MNYNQIYAKKKRYAETIRKQCPCVANASGIYILTREEEGFKYAYIGQSVNVLDRLVAHMMGYEQWIDRSIKKHKLFSQDNPTGWKIECFYCNAELLDNEEKRLIREYANKGYQLRNVTAGGQGVGKNNIGSNKPSKGYRDGIRQGRKNLARELSLCLKRLNVSPNSTGKLDTRAWEKFFTLIEDELDEGN